MYISEKFSVWDLYRKLTEMQWKGKYFSVDNITTYLSEDNKTLAVVEYDNKKSLIVSVKFK